MTPCKCPASTYEEKTGPRGVVTWLSTCPEHGVRGGLMVRVAEHLKGFSCACGGPGEAGVHGELECRLLFGEK